jgi:tRNA G18 (ribose-2'-O)-methylase SpoU
MSMRKRTTTELIAEKQSLEEFVGLPKTPVTLVVDGIRSLDNVGLLFRLADAFRISQLALCGITGYPAGRAGDDRPPHIIERHDRRIKKTAIQTIPFVPWTYATDVLDVVAERKKVGDMVVVLEQTDRSQPYRDAAYRFPLTLVVGHEREGVNAALLPLADAVVEIPMRGMGNSHNVAIATAIMLAHVETLHAADDSRPFDEGG